MLGTLRHAFDQHDGARPPTLDYASRRPRKPLGWSATRSLFAAILLCAGLGFVAVFIAMPRSHGCRESATRIKSGSNLRQIEQAARQYDIDHGEYPDSFQTLVLRGTDLRPDAFVSPMTSDTPATSWMAMFSQPGHISYIWVGTGLKATSTADHVIGYQRFDSWKPGTNVLFSDGSVRFMTATELEEAMRLVAARVGGPLRGAPGWSPGPRQAKIRNLR